MKMTLLMRFCVRMLLARWASVGRNAQLSTQSAMVAVGLCGAWLPHAAFGVTGVGTATYVSGTVYTQPMKGDKHLVQVGDAIENGDTIETAKGAEVVLVMDDHQRIYLKEDTLYRLDDFHYSAQVPAQSYSVTSLLKGGLRVISGLIGKQGNPNAYELKTQMSTIGIRGTEWSVDEGDDSHPGENIVVYQGQIAVSTGTYQEDLSAGQGTILHTRHSPVIPTPADQVRGVQPSPAAAAACG